MRIVLDTNVLLVSIPRNSKYRIIFDNFLSNKYTLIISNEILSEYAEIIEEKANSMVSTNLVEMLMSAINVEKQEIFFQWKLIDVDKDDNKFADCAVAGNVDYLVTNDSHFNVLKTIRFPLIRIVTIDEFLAILNNG